MYQNRVSVRTEVGLQEKNIPVVGITWSWGVNIGIDSDISETEVYVSVIPDLETVHLKYSIYVSSR